MCENNGIKLIHIFEDEWISKQEIIKNKLKHIIGATDNNKIYARNCKIDVIKSDICNKFLDKYHIQGADKSLIRLGAFYNDELVAVMTFGKLRLALGNKHRYGNKYEMYRFCSYNTTVIGIGGKLFNYFINNYEADTVISYADMRWSNSSSFYSKIGFELIGKTLPNYWYVDKNYSHRYYRFNFRKDVLKNKLINFNINLTEWQNMQLNGYDRIWDCGSLKFEWKRFKK
jgi:hypothetical protein